jgi:thiol-disulfide isomerase/thioredoxin
MSMLASGENSYTEAHAQVLKSGEPMVVMVTADWCPACQTMKTTVLPQVEEHGLLRRVVFAVVNVDKEQELGKKLIANGPIPQLLMYRHTSDGWRLRRLVGGQSPDTVEEFINKGIELNRTQQAPPQEPQQAEPQPSKHTTVSQQRTATAASTGNAAH